MLVTDDGLLHGKEPVAACLAAERGGVSCVQLRLKRASSRDLVALARALRVALTVPLIVNDRPDVAGIVGSGVHLGPDDVAVPLARTVLGAGAVIGASVGDEDEAERARDADYWGVGPWRTTGTKSDAGPALGSEGFRRLVALAGGRPCLAIGGVKPEDVAEVRRAGGAGVAVASGILAMDDIEAAAQRYAAQLR
jgi:thiamine-phosphate pyrophosphorylase